MIRIKPMILILLLVVLLAYGVQAVQATSGGPDNFGYTFKDNNETGGPAYQWVDISTTGTMILNSSDDAYTAQNIPVGFFFNFYGTNYSQVSITNNGIILARGGDSQYSNDPINQSPNLHNFIAPFWDDLVTWGSADSSITYETMGTAPNREFVVEWYDNQHYHNSEYGITFEAILYEGSNNILFQYKNVTFADPNNSSAAGAQFNNGSSATVGIEGPDGQGLQYSYNQPDIFANMSILFKFPAFSGTNMRLSKIAPQSMDKGHMMTYTLYYSNFGNVSATNVTIQDPLPDNVDFVSATDGGVYYDANRTVVWDVGTVSEFPTGHGTANVTVKIQNTTTVGTIIQNIASISTSRLETRYDDNNASASTVVTGTNLPPDVDVGPVNGVTGGTPSVYWENPVTFTYEGDMNVTGVDINIHSNDGSWSDVNDSMAGGPPVWTYTITFYPRHGSTTVRYTVHYLNLTNSTEGFNIYIDPAGYVYDLATGARIQNATVWLQWPDGVGGWENVPVGNTTPIMQPDVNPLITGADGQYQWDTLAGSYRVHVEAPGYYPADSIVVSVPPPVTDLYVGLTRMPDNTAPTTNVTLAGTQGNNGWYTSNVTATLSAVDNVGGWGVNRTEYSYDGSTWYNYTAPLNITANGQTALYYRSVDNATNVETAKNVTVKVDRTIPAIQGAATTAPNAHGWYGSNVTINFTASDNVSGIASLTPNTTISTEGANQSVTGNASDNAGNSASYTVSGINIDKTRPAVGAINASDNAETNTTVQFRANFTELNAFAAVWNWGDGSNATGAISGNSASGSHAYTAAGSYNVTVTITDMAGNVGKSANYTITVVSPTPSGNPCLASLLMPLMIFGVVTIGVATRGRKK